MLEKLGIPNQTSTESHGGESNIPQDNSTQHVANILAGAYQITEDSPEIIKFGLTPEEKKSIERDIEAEKPIADTPAYRKFLAYIFPNKTIIFPYLPTYTDALTVVGKLSELFGVKVGLSYEGDQTLRLMKDQQHYAGSRGRGSTEDRIINEGIMGMVWCARTDSHNDRMAPVAWQFHGNGKYRSGTKNIYIEDGHSMIPIFV